MEGKKITTKPHITSCHNMQKARHREAEKLVSGYIARKFQCKDRVEP